MGIPFDTVPRHNIFSFRIELARWVELFERRFVHMSTVDTREEVDTFDVRDFAESYSIQTEDG